MREPATGCMASLYDDKGNHIAPLWWRDPADTQKRQITIDLDSGQQADLFLFVQRNDDVPNVSIRRSCDGSAGVYGPAGRDTLTCGA